MDRNVFGGNARVGSPGGNEGLKGNGVVCLVAFCDGAIRVDLNRYGMIARGGCAPDDSHILELTWFQRFRGKCRAYEDAAVGGVAVVDVSLYSRHDYLGAAVADACSDRDRGGVAGHVHPDKRCGDIGSQIRVGTGCGRHVTVVAVVGEPARCFVSGNRSVVVDVGDVVARLVPYAAGILPIVIFRSIDFDPLLGVIRACRKIKTCNHKFSVAITVHIGNDNPLVKEVTVLRCAYLIFMDQCPRFPVEYP